jgi:phosphate-selective porin OprO/OprP
LGFRFGVLYAVGRVKDFNVSVGLDFGADPGIDSAWIEGAKGGLEVWGHYLGKLRIGYVGEPFSLERQGGFYDTTFLERSLPVQVMAPGYNIGTMVHDSRRDGRLSWAAGLFSIGQNNEKNASTSRLSLTGRVSFLPVYRDEGRRLIHVGLSVSSRSPTGSDVRYHGRPEARFVDDLVDTGSFSASHQTLWGVEAATVNGPIWAAAEIIGSDTKAQSVGDPNFRGGYVQVGWFITGESRPYQTNGGTFGRVLPLTKYGGGNPFKKRNGGAWEVAGRISHLDLDDGLIEGGKLTDFSAALNWYVNAAVRVKLNYIYARPRDRGSANIILLRVQYNPW